VVTGGPLTTSFDKKKGGYTYMCRDEYVEGAYSTQGGLNEVVPNSGKDNPLAKEERDINQRTATISVCGDKTISLEGGAGGRWNIQNRVDGLFSHTKGTGCPCL